MIRAVLFDYGGVLTEAGSKGSVGKEIAEHFGIEPSQLNIDDIESKLRRGEMETSEFFKQLNERHPSPTPYTSQLFMEGKDELGGRRPKVYEVAAKLRGNDVRTGILSNVFEISATRLKELGCYTGFEPVILSCETGLEKPNPEIYEFAVAALELEPEEIVFIDDDPQNLIPARALGMLTVHADSQKQLAKGLPSLFVRLNGIDVRPLD